MTLVGSLVAAITGSPRLHLTAETFGLTASVQLLGAVVGAPFFGWLTGKLDRRSSSR